MSNKRLELRITDVREEGMDSYIEGKSKISYWRKNL